MLTSIHSFPSSLIFQPLKPLQPSCPTKTLILTCTSQPKSAPEPNKKRPTSKNRRKSSYGTSRRSSLKKTLIQEQVVFTAPVSDDPVVAIIGGGMAGLTCALNLEKRGVRSTVFDTVG
jgi:NADPH-dependent 2,4-dienoyl-CoA reductase/sulfur reductase-like enzyme